MYINQLTINLPTPLVLMILFLKICYASAVVRFKNHKNAKYILAKLSFFGTEF